MSILEIVFLGHCEMFVCLDFVHFSLGREAHRSANGGVNSLKNVDFSDTDRLNISFTCRLKGWKASFNVSPSLCKMAFLILLFS